MNGYAVEMFSKSNGLKVEIVSQSLRAHRYGYVRAELHMCVRKDRIVSVTDDFNMQE